MKKIYPVLFALLAFCNKPIAQNYYLNVPVYDTFANGRFYQGVMVLGINPPNVLSIDTALVNDIYGVNFYLKVVASTYPQNTLQASGVGALNVGDTVLLTHNNNIRFNDTIRLSFNFPLSASANDSFDYIILAEGVPNQVLDSFYCKADWHKTSTLPDPTNKTHKDYFTHGATKNCQVLDTTSTTKIAADLSLRNDIRVFPNPFRERIHIESSEKINELDLVDITGRLLLSTNNVETLNAYCATLTPGQYFLKLVTAAGSKYFKLLKE